MNICQKGKYIFIVAGSKSVAGRHKKVYIETWENQRFLRKFCKSGKNTIIEYASLVVGLNHSRGVNSVMAIEGINPTRRV